MKNRSEINFKNKNNFFRKHPFLKMGVPAFMIISMFVLLSLSNAVGHSSAEELTATENTTEMNFAKNFGGSDYDELNSIIEVDGGYIAVGSSNPDSFGNGDWAGVEGKGGLDATIIKFDTEGNVIWAKNFGGSDYDEFTNVTADSDGYIAVGESFHDSFGNGDWVGVAAKGSFDATIVKFDTDGNVIWAKNFGGKGIDEYYAATTVDGGYVSVGTSNASSFGNGDWAGVSGHGNNDAIIVKYDTDGNLLWKKNFGGSGTEVLYSVTSDGSGYIAAGMSLSASSGSGGSGSVCYAIIIKLDTNGDVIWNKTFGEGNYDIFNSVTADGSGYIAVGSSEGTGDPDTNENESASIVKFDTDGNVLWNKTFGGSGSDSFYSVAAVSDGYFAAGVSDSDSFGSGDWTGVAGKGDSDAILVKFDTNGDVVWKMNFGGNGYDSFETVIAVGNGCVAVGTSEEGSFGNGDWIGIDGKGDVDGILVEIGNIPGGHDSSSNNSLVWVIIAIIVIVYLAAIYFLYRRRKNKSEE